MGGSSTPTHSHIASLPLPKYLYLEGDSPALLVVPVAPSAEVDFGGGNAVGGGTSRPRRPARYVPVLIATLGGRDDAKNDQGLRALLAHPPSHLALLSPPLDKPWCTLEPFNSSPPVGWVILMNNRQSKSFAV